MIAIRALVIPVFICTSLTQSMSTSGRIAVPPTLPTTPPVIEQILPQKTMPSASSHKKTIYLIRHAESLENVAYKGARRVQQAYVSRKLPNPRDVIGAFQLVFKMFRPSVMNAALSELGEKQVSQLHTNLEKDRFWDKLAQRQPREQPLLLVHSPLVRAKQTAYGALLGPEYMSPDETPDASATVRIEELPSLKEVNPGEIIGDAVTPWRKRKTIDDRIDNFEDWIQSRPEDTIVVVGHSVYFKRMLNLPKTFENCDVWEAKYDTSSSDAGKKMKLPKKTGDEDDTVDLPRSWKSLRRLYRYSPEKIPEVDEEAE